MCDFGIAKILQNTNDLAKTCVGTPYYISPEICNGMKYNYKSDIWSLGILLYELCTLRRPFEGDNLGAVIAKILNSTHKPISNNYSGDLHNLINIMLIKDAKKRCNLDDILKYKKISE